MTRPSHALQRFEVAGSHGEGFPGGKGLVNNQTESAGADEPTVPRRERRGCNHCVPCADGTKTKLHRSAGAGSLPSSSEDYDSPRSLGR